MLPKKQGKERDKVTFYLAWLKTKFITPSLELIVTKIYKRFLEKKFSPKKSEKGERVHKGFFNELIRVNLSRNKKKYREFNIFSC